MNDKKSQENEDDKAIQARQAANKASLIKARVGEKGMANTAFIAKARTGEYEHTTKARQAADKALHGKAWASEHEPATKARQAANKASHTKARGGEDERGHVRRLEQQRPRNAAAAFQKACQPAQGSG